MGSAGHPHTGSRSGTEIVATDLTSLTARPALQPRSGRRTLVRGGAFLLRLSAGAQLAVYFLGATAEARAQVTPDGQQFQVDSYTTNVQWFPAVAADAQDRFIVTWESLGSSGTDTSSFSIQAQRYDVGGEPLGPQFQVNSYTTSYQYDAVIAATGQGDFVVAWQSWVSSGTDTDAFSIQARRYDANGDPQGPEFQVNTTTTDFQEHPEIARDGQGGFVVAWDSTGPSGPDPGGFSIQAQRFDSAGDPSGGELAVNSYTTGFQGGAAVAADEQGNFVVVWHSQGSGGTDTSGYSIQSRRYSADGTPLGAQFQVNTFTSNDQSGPAVAMGRQGRFLVAWDGEGTGHHDTSGYSIRAQRFDANGTPLGNELQVNSYTTGNQVAPAVAVDEQGNFVVAWYSVGSSGTDTSSYSVQAQRLDGNGVRIGGEFQVNSYTSSVQVRPAVAVDGQGDFWIAWESYGSWGTDTSVRSIQAQAYHGDLFRDAFESGDTGRWSSTAP